VTLRGVDVPVPANDVVRAVASSEKNKFMVITSSQRDTDGATVLKTLHTSNAGASWLEAFEVGSFLPNPSSQSLVQATFTTGKWLILLDSIDGFHALSTMTATVPFEFDWRAALKAANIIKFNGNAGKLALSVNRARITLIREEPVTIDPAPLKLSLMFCVIAGNNAATVSANFWSLILVAIFLGFVI
jgi:hypothetical protein